MPIPLDKSQVTFDPDPLEWLYVLAEDLLKQHNLWEQGWRFEVSNEKNSLGRCNYRKKQISYSQYYLHVPHEEIVDTILHEIAHALTPNDKAHGWKWREKCREIGARPQRCAPRGTESSAQYNYLIKCENGCWEAGRHRLRKSLFKAHCARCGGAIKVFKRNPA